VGMHANENGPLVINKDESKSYLLRMKLILRNFLICALYQILLQWSNQGGWAGLSVREMRSA